MTTATRQFFARSAFVSCVMCCGVAAGCTSSPYTDTIHSPQTTAGTTPSDASVDNAGAAGDSQGTAKPSDTVKSPTSTCRPAVASEHLRARDNVLAAARNRIGGMNVASTVPTKDLFDKVHKNCGCHVDLQSAGGLHVSLEDFPARITAEALRRITSDDSKVFMPPPEGGGMAFSARGTNDPIVELAGLMRAWLAAGSPTDAFTPTSATTGSTTVGPYFYQLEPDVGKQLTNIGNCIPDKGMVAADDAKSVELDKMFAGATELPARLEQTDVTSFDAKVLARQGVVAFAPAYPLWADNAKKIRMVRVPRGESIRFDKGAQTFIIPPNTRFYKTFLKRVIDLTGQESYRKMETRLIVSRPDEIQADGSRKPQALFGTYAWNKEESEAVLVRDPLRNGKPFADRLVPYQIDEPKADAIIAEGLAPAELPKALEKAGVMRTYAIPGSERCIQCHMGAHTASFILGFTPLQIHRQPLGHSGVIEPADSDELNQLQRLIDYGVITGMTSPSDVVLLENSQGSRKPRNDDELKAQGYMLGNCAHCHNPFGFPSVSAPELRDVLSFDPSEKGGIFQFPLDLFSPRNHRGERQETRIPYVTPSMYDFGEIAFSSTGNRKVFLAKDAKDPSRDGRKYLLAPWRSLIYRNVDAPFSYVDDDTIFPHMPRNTPGYDCRARRLLGSWMVGIPALPKGGAPFASESAEVAESAAQEQPYEEVKPGDANYELAVRNAYYRQQDFTKSLRYNDCPDPSLDIVDPAIRDNATVASLHSPAPHFVENDTLAYVLPVPSRAHWFATDNTDAPGDWYPRRADWQKVVVDHQEDLLRLGEKLVLTSIEQRGKLITGNDELRSFALTPIPFGIWQENPSCKFENVQTVSQIPADKRPWWMLHGAEPNHQPAAEAAHVYSIRPGAQVFATICRNCHGPNADGKSRLADTISDLTGGDTRVANLRDGLFGPPSMPGAARKRVFGAVQQAGVDLQADDWAARYVAWMGLGGTQKLIPSTVLNLIANGFILGEPRGGGGLAGGDPNMLKLAQDLCGRVLPGSVDQYAGNAFDARLGALVTPASLTFKFDHRLSTLIYANGDGELWTQLCTLQNPLPVRAVYFAASDEEGKPELFIDPRAGHGLYRRAAYGPYPVGDDHGMVVQGIDVNNRAPWCIREPASAEERAQLAEYLSAQKFASPTPPYCPATLDETARFANDDVAAWNRNGAMNAAVSVFLYLDALAKGEVTAQPDYNRCDQLSKQ